MTQRPKRRVSLGVVVNAETGEVIEGGAGRVGAKRKSQRRHTIMNTSATVNRIKDAEEKRVREVRGCVFLGGTLQSGFAYDLSHVGCDSKEDENGYSITDARRTDRTRTRYRRGEHHRT